MKGYKVFNSDFSCRGFQYEVSKTYEEDVVPDVREVGFHFCQKLADCFGYYDFNPNNKVAEIEAIGDIDEGDNKCCTNKITIVKEITWQEVLEMVNTGKCDTGLRNSGNRNSGNRNSGNCNSGNWNSGDCNSGNHNSGNCNSGGWNKTSFSAGVFCTEQRIRKQRIRKQRKRKQRKRKQRKQKQRKRKRSIRNQRTISGSSIVTRRYSARRRQQSCPQK